MNPERTIKNNNLKADIVIIGSGGGLVAALAAAEEGAKGIIVLEKQGAVGGHLRLADGFFACESSVQQLERTVADRDECFKTFMKWNHWARVNPRLVRAYINKSGDSILWFQEKGIDFELRPVFPNQSPRTYHSPIVKGEKKRYGRCNELFKVMTKQCEELEVQTLLHTRCKKILRGVKGNVTGIIAVKDRAEFEITARSVIIATGGFTGNRDLLNKYCPDWDDSWPLDAHAKHCTGDGLLMAKELGAGIADPKTIGTLLEGPAPDISMADPSFGLSGSMWGYVRDPRTVWVNKRGKRFIDEAAGYIRWESVKAMLLQPDKITYCLFDDEIRKTVEEKGTILDAEITKRTSIPGVKEELGLAQTKGLAKISDSWDGIANWIGADPEVLKAEIDGYNAACEQGYDQIFAKERRHLLPLRRAPYYSIRCIVTCGETLGGINVNERMEVLDTQGNVIPGLYVAGAIADGWQGLTYCAKCGGSCAGFAINSGRIAGENAAKFVCGSYS
jgi:fumarate reductase flavoprotein subunit